MAKKSASKTTSKPAGKPMGSSKTAQMSKSLSQQTGKSSAKSPGQSSGPKNEGEGNKTAARNYNAGTKQFVESGKVGAAAKAAEKAIDGPEGKELRKAEKAGLKPSRR